MGRLIDVAVTRSISSVLSPDMNERVGGVGEHTLTNKLKNAARALKQIFVMFLEPCVVSSKLLP